MTAAEWDKAHLWRFRARLVKIIDADTVRLECDTGFGSRHEADLRLAGIDAPEVGTPEGGLAAFALAGLLGGRPPWHWPLRVETTQLKTRTAEQTSFARYVGRLWLEGKDGALLDVGEWLVARGHARPLDAA